MPGKRRLATIEEKAQNDSPQLEQLLVNIRNTQLDLLNNIIVFPLNTPIRNLMVAFDKIIYEKFLNNASETFHSIQAIHQTFDRLLADFMMESQILQVADTYKPLCDGLQLIIQWYKIQAIEFFLHKPLAREVAVLEDKTENKTLLHERFTTLSQKIIDYNQRLERVKESLNNFRLSLSGLKITPLADCLGSLEREEMVLNEELESTVLRELAQERNNLSKQLEELNRDMHDKITACKIVLRKQKDKRESVHELKLDVYYLKEFEERYPEELNAYKKLIHSKQRDKFIKIEAVEKLIQSLSNPVRNFELALTQYYQNTSNIFHLVSANSYAINGIYELLNKQFSVFKLNSTILKSELQYQSLYQYLREGLPQVEKLVEENFMKAAKNFLNDIAERNVLRKSKMYSEVDEAFENETQREVNKIKYPHPIPNIKYVKFKFLKKDLLNQKWREVFDYIFSQEIEAIKAEFNLIDSLPAESIPIVLKQMEGKLEIKYNELNTIPEISRTLRACEVLREVYISSNRDPVILAIKERLKALDNTTVSPIEQKLTPITPIKTGNLENKSPWYSIFIDKDWKRAICYGLLTFSLVVGAFTVWGLFAELAAVTLITAGFTVGSVCAVLAAGAYYLVKKCCCHGHEEAFGAQNSTSDSIIHKSPSERIQTQKTSPSQRSRLAPEVKDNEHSHMGFGLFKRHKSRQDNALPWTELAVVNERKGPG